MDSYVTKKFNKSVRWKLNTVNNVSAEASWPARWASVEKWSMLTFWRRLAKQARGGTAEKRTFPLTNGWSCTLGRGSLGDGARQPALLSAGSQHPSIPTEVQPQISSATAHLWADVLPATGSALSRQLNKHTLPPHPVTPEHRVDEFSRLSNVWGGLCCRKMTFHFSRRGGRGLWIPERMKRKEPEGSPPPGRNLNQALPEESKIAALGRTHAKPSLDIHHRKDCFNWNTVWL